MSEPRSTRDRSASPFGCFDRRYLIEIVPALVVLAALTGLMFVLPRTPTLKLWAHGLLGLTMGYTIVVSVAAIRRLDELQQRIHLVAIAISFTATGVLVNCREFLQRVGVGSPEGVWLWLIMAGIWFAGIFALRRRYR